MDLIPVDYLPLLSYKLLGLEYTRVVPSADINAPFGLSITVLAIILIYSVKGKGLVGFGKELLFHPFGKNPLLWPANILLNLVELIAKPVSLALRLFRQPVCGRADFSFLLPCCPGGFSSSPVVHGPCSIFWWCRCRPLSS